MSIEERKARLADLVASLPDVVYVSGIDDGAPRGVPSLRCSVRVLWPGARAARMWPAARRTGSRPSGLAPRPGSFQAWHLRINSQAFETKMPEMEEIIKNLGSPAWWFAVVVVGVGVNILTGGVQAGAAMLTSKYSKIARLRSFKARRRHLTAVANACSNPRVFDYYVSEKTSSIASAAWWIGLAAFMTGLICILYLPVEAKPELGLFEIPRKVILFVRKGSLLSTLLCLLFSIRYVMRGSQCHAVVIDSIIRPQRKSARIERARRSRDEFLPPGVVSENGK
ncbi:hypothetical protein EPAKOI_005155 (plasmid) [Cupriavidus sp. H18C2]